MLLLRIFEIVQIYTGKWLQGMSLCCLSGFSLLEFYSSSDSKCFFAYSIRQEKQGFYESLYIYLSLIKLHNHVFPSPIKEN